MTSQADSVRTNCAVATKHVEGTLFSAAVWERFWSKVDKRGPDECWEWRGAQNGLGYGQLKIGGTNLRASRMIAAHSAGRDLRPEELACHRCDNPPCVNPAHIFIGSARDNVIDMLRKGRNGRGAKTRIGRIRVAHQRQSDRMIDTMLWGTGGFKFDLFTMAPVEELAVFCDVIPNDVELEDEPETDGILDNAAANAALDEAIASLPFKMRAVMHLRRQGLTLEDVGGRLRLTRERIRQIEEKAIPKLQKHRAIAELIRGAPFPAPVTKPSISSERVRVINEKCAAFFERKAQATPIAKPRRGRPKGVKDSKPRRPPLTGCSFCQSRDHRINECLERWRFERRKEAA